MFIPHRIDVRQKRTNFSPFSKITVQGYKSIVDETSVEFKNLTIFAGVNSSGKSSIFQPLLLLKQTLDVSTHPGEILINGPHLEFTLIEQFLSKTENGQSNSFSRIRKRWKKSLKVIYEQEEKHFKITQIDYLQNFTLISNMTHDEYYQINPHKGIRTYNTFGQIKPNSDGTNDKEELKADYH